MLVAGVFAAVFFAFVVVGGSFDDEAYNANIQRIQANDFLATQIFEAAGAPDDEYYRLVDGGIKKYQENLTLLSDAEKLEALPAELLEQVEDIRQYTELRIEQYGLILEAAQDENPTLLDDITNLGLRIEALGIYQEGSALQGQP